MDPNVFEPTCFKMFMPFSAGGRTELGFPFVCQRFFAETLDSRLHVGPNIGRLERVLCMYPRKKTLVLFFLKVKVN